MTHRAASGGVDPEPSGLQTESGLEPFPISLLVLLLKQRADGSYGSVRILSDQLYTCGRLCTRCTKS